MRWTPQYSPSKQSESLGDHSRRQSYRGSGRGSAPSGASVAILLPRARFGTHCTRAPERRKPRRSGAFVEVGGTGLEPVTPSLSSRSDRSRPLAQVRSTVARMARFLCEGWPQLPGLERPGSRKKKDLALPPVYPRRPPRPCTAPFGLWSQQCPHSRPSQYLQGDSRSGPLAGRFQLPGVAYRHVPELLRRPVGQPRPRVPRGSRACPGRSGFGWGSWIQGSHALGDSFPVCQSCVNRDPKWHTVHRSDTLTRPPCEEETRLFAGVSWKPSDGLEPSTPSLPWRCSTN